MAEDFTAEGADSLVGVSTAVEADSMEEGVSTAVEDFMAGVDSMVAAGFAAGAGFVAARSAEERDFAVERSAAAFAETASAAAGAGADAVGVGEEAGAGVGTGAGRIGVGDTDMAIRTDIGTTRGGRRLITRPAMISTTILTTILRPPILRLATRIEIIRTGTTGT